jgi:hypothetical protein
MHGTDTEDVAVAAGMAQAPNFWISPTNDIASA